MNSMVFMPMTLIMILHISQSLRFKSYTHPSLSVKMLRPQSLEQIVADSSIPLQADFSQLPDSFEDMISRASKRTLDCLLSGVKRVRIDVDTTVGDLTYTTLKNTVPIVKELVKELAKGLDLSMPTEIDSLSYDNMSNDTRSSTAITPEMMEMTRMNSFHPDKTCTIFCPDMGAASLLRRDWKIGSGSIIHHIASIY